MKVKIKKLHPDAVIPKYANPGDAALDLVAINDGEEIYKAHEDGQTIYWEYHTGIALEIPEYYVGLIFPRSSISNYTLSLANAVGVVDSSYRGEITFRFAPNGAAFHNPQNVRAYNKGDKIGQLLIVPYPKIELEETDTLSGTIRGAGGYGSSGA